MIKKVILLSIVILIIGGGAFIFLTTKSSSSTSNTLSERSKAYLLEQQKKDDSELKYARLGKGEDKAGAFVGKRVEVGDCFSFVMVFRVSNPREESLCNWYFGIDQPKGFITAYMQKMENISSVDGVDGVSMRRQFTNKYTEEQQTIRGVKYLIFRSKDLQRYEASAFAYAHSQALLFNLIVPSTENYDPQFQAMLESIQINNNKK